MDYVFLTGVSIEEQLSTGGTLWFMDLTMPDTTWILPITLGFLNLLIVEVWDITIISSLADSQFTIANNTSVILSKGRLENCDISVLHLMQSAQTVLFRLW